MLYLVYNIIHNNRKKFQKEKGTREEERGRKGKEKQMRKVG